MKTTTANDTIIIPTNNVIYTYDYSIDCGPDGLINGSQTDTNQTGNANCVYATAGTHTITITGTFPHFYGNDQGDITKLYNISQWGDNPWASFRNAFWGASNLGSDPSLTFATDDPNLSNVTDMGGMFAFANSFDQSIGSWNVANVTSMRFMFSDAHSFDQPIGSWNVANVTDMSNMFNSARTFDQDLGDWNVANVTDMSNMFNNARLSYPNYDTLLIGWAAQMVQNRVVFDGGTSQYSALGEVGRNTLTSTPNDWMITDGGLIADRPSGITLTHNSLPENSTIGTIIGTLQITDPVMGKSYTFSIGGEDQASFSLVDDSLLVTTAMFYVETKTNYNITIDAIDAEGLSVRASFIIYVGPLGIEDGEELHTLYPNPVINQLTVALEEVIHSPVVSVYSLAGQLVEIPYTLANKQLVLDVSQLVGGTYVLHIIHKNGELKGRFVKH